MKRRVFTSMIGIAVGLFSFCATWTVAEETFDADTPLETLREAAKSGAPAAQDQLARRLLDGKAHSPQAIRVLADTEAELQKLWDYGQMHEYAIPQSPESQTPAAQAWKEKFQKAKANYGKLKNSIEESETKEALELIDSAVAKKYSDSMLLLAWLCSDGKRIPKNLERSVELNQKAAELGNATAMKNLGFKYGQGEGVEKNITEAVKWFEKAYAKGSYGAGSALADVLTDGGLNGKDDGYAKNPKRAYVLGRALQLASERGSTAYQWGSQNVEKARQNLEPDQLLAAETEAEKEAERLKAAAAVKPASSQPAISLKNPSAITKQQWRDAFGKIDSVFAVSGTMQPIAKEKFVELCGEPKKTQTVEDSVYWYYECKDGVLQLVLDKGLLLTGVVSGQVNDY